MKITGIDIGEYRQFKNIKFDFTYPQGHPKAGQPLEKVCFIGQSGTGKTTLLNVIWEFIDSLNEQEANHDYNDPTSSDYDPPTTEEHFLYSTSAFINHHLVTRRVVEVTILEGDEILYQDISDHLEFNDIPDAFPRQYQPVTSSKHHGIYIKDSVSREADAFLVEQEGMPKRLVTTIGQVAEDKASYLKWINEAGSKKNIALGDMDTVPFWLYLLNEIIEYDEATPSFMIKLGQNTNLTPHKTVAELQLWLAKNPRFELANKCLNPILEKFFLELSLTGESKSPISLKTKAGVQIPNNTLSTGTRQLLATAIPIYKFDTKGTVILFDEPERSLFPDIQRELVKYYTGLAPEAQFFFATHSPIIAAAFEPCERFILYFDKNGEVNYRKGEAPIGDDPNDVLRKDFWMNPLMHEEGLAAYRKYLDLATRIRNEMDENKKNQLIVERLELGNLYNFAGQHAPY